MPSVAQTIRDALMLEIRKVTNIGAVKSDWEHWATEGRLPAAFVILDSEESVRNPTQSKEVLAHFRIATLLSKRSPNDAFDTLKAAIENEIEDDPTLGGIALDAFYTAAGPFATTSRASGRKYTRDLFVDVLYRHPRGAA